MKTSFFKFFIIFIYISTCNVYANTILSSEKYVSYKGGVIFFEISKNEYQSGYKLDEINLLVLHRNDKYYLLYGVPYQTKVGKNKITVSNNKSKRIFEFIVKEKKFDKQFIEIKKKYTAPSNDQLIRISKEKNTIGKYRDIWTSNKPDISFVRPANGVVTGVFGTRRFYNGVEGRYHNGYDIAGDETDYVLAPSSGEVILVGNFFYNGKFVYINHGSGLKSIFLHLSKILVKKGDIVDKGQVIGQIGSTGASTGPHLHWSVSLNQTYVNPELFLSY
ncbi:MAG: peptidase M23 [Gammaproteobacteria bacterium]|nr:peptidase M23 [Gammaproteobacteria bacterium]|tara:strand:- start:233254 stop:234081 length:828 start_codon:yes stop_codon:yes gene_type:complete